MHRTILIPLDGSSFSEQALPYAEAIASRTNAGLALVHAHEPLRVDGLTPDPSWDEQLVEQARAYLDGIADRVRGRTGVEVSARLLRGDPVNAVRDDLEAHGADLIVMTTHGRTGVQRAWLGSVADGLVRRSGAPVLLIRPEDEPRTTEPTFRHVLVPLAGGGGSERILDPAVAIGRLNDARFTLLRVVPPSMVVGGHVFRLDQKRLDELTAHADDYLRTVGDRLADDGHDVETVVLEDPSPATAILDWTAERDVDLIAMATRGQGGLRRWLLGSVADKIVRSSPVPVLLYRAADENGDDESNGSAAEP